MYMHFSKTIKMIANHQNYITNVIKRRGKTKNISHFIEYLELVNFRI